MLKIKVRFSDRRFFDNRRKGLKNAANNSTMGLSEEELEKVLNSPEYKRVEKILDESAIKYEYFLNLIYCDVLLCFSEDKVKIYTFGKSSVSVEKAIADFTEPIPRQIEQYFDESYRKLKDVAEPFTSLAHDDIFDELTKLRSDMQLLDALVNAADNIKKCNPVFLDIANSFVLLEELFPIYGEVKDGKNSCRRIIERSESGEIDRANFVAISRNNSLAYCAHCRNLYQICGAVLNYLMHFEIKREGEVSVRYNLRRCERCGRYFISENRKKKYCPYLDSESQKTCQTLQEDERKREDRNSDKSNLKRIAQNEIKDRLYSNRRSAENKKVPNDEEIAYRDARWCLFDEKNREHSKLPDYKEWVNTGIEKINQGYGAFDMWLHGKEK